MKHLLETLLMLRRYSKLVRLRDAMVLLGDETSAVKEICVRSRELKRSIALRLGTSDFQVFLKILQAREYDFALPCHVRLIIDAGANIGISSLFFANRYPDARVYAIEPESRNFDLLVRNCATQPNIIPVKAALWGSLTQVKMTNPLAESWSFAYRQSTNGHHDVPTITVSEILKLSKLETIDILKLDIEGAEKDVFTGDCDDWLPLVNLIIMELHDRFIPGCSRAFYSKLINHRFKQETHGENVFVSLRQEDSQSRE